MKQRHLINTKHGEVPVFIKENSIIAKFAAWKLNSSQVAIVVGDTIHLYRTSADEFLSNLKWVRHEMCHIKQFRELGFMNFIMHYLWESVRKGYYNNRFEVEAREAEQSW
jgi:hypothetical protein